MLSPGLTMELMSWRERVERQFVFKPEHGVTFDEASQAGNSGVKRFKAAQASRILMAAAAARLAGQVANEQLAAQLAQFEQAAERARDVVKDLRDVQSDRRSWERLLNRSPQIDSRPQRGDAGNRRHRVVAVCITRRPRTATAAEPLHLAGGHDFGEGRGAGQQLSRRRRPAGGASFVPA